MGQSCKLREKETKNLLIINNGECLTTDSVKEKLNSIEQLFSNK
jgi:hypothetical protein